MKIPFYVAAASVPPGNRVAHFHGSGEDSASALLAHFPRFRHGSFDVAIPGWPEPGPDESLEQRWDDRKVVRLYQDGTLLFRARADSEFLGWGVEPHAFSKFPKLDLLVVVEVNTSFVHRYRAVVQKLKEEPPSVSLHLQLQDFVQNGTRLFLTQYMPKDHVDWSVATRWEAQQTETQFQVSVADLLETPNRVAFELVRSFTSMFDLPEEHIPFVQGSGADRRIDLDAIKAL